MKMGNYVLYIWVLISLMARGCESVRSKQQPADEAHTVMPSTAPWLKDHYNHVVRIEEKDIAKSGDQFLIDIPLMEKADSNYVFFLDARVPSDLFVRYAGFYPEIKELIIIAPDWEFYEQLAADAQKNGIVLEPATTNLYYHILREEGKIQVDSLRISGDGHPQLEYSTPVVPKNMLAVYRTESYGSVCCPEDPRWKIAGEDPAFIKDFEQRHQIRVTDTYRQNNGKEGEHTLFYTLPKLTTEQRLSFILEKRSQWIVNKETKDIVFSAQIFTPQLVPFVNTGFTKMSKL